MELKFPIRRKLRSRQLSDSPELPPKVAWTKKWGFSKKNKFENVRVLVIFFCTEVKLFPFNTNEMEDCIVVLFTAIVALASYNDVLFGGGTT